MQTPTLPSEVILLIAPYLARTTLLRCMRINRIWHDSLEPFLWRHPVLRPAPSSSSSSMDQDRRMWEYLELRAARALSPSSQEHEQLLQLQLQLQHPPSQPLPPAALILKNACYVRTLHVENSTLLTREFVAPALGCCLLTSFSVSHAADVEAVLAILHRTADTLDTFSYRSHLRVSGFNLQSDPSRLSRRLWDALPACKALTRLKITSAGIPVECHEAFFNVCEHLEQLTLLQTIFAQDQHQHEPVMEEQNEEATVIARLCPRQFPHLKTLILLNNSMSAARQVALIHGAAPALTTLTWKTASRFYTRCMGTCLIEYAVPLTKLDVSLSNLTDSQFVRILIHLPHLTCLDAQGTGFGSRSAQFLIDHRAAQLEELNLKGCTTVDGRRLQLLLETSPRLRRFLCGFIDIHLVLASWERGSGWASRDFVELDISISELTSLDEPMIGMDRLLCQIGVMTQLEILAMIVVNNVKIEAFNLEPGGVFSERLGGLKKLRQLMMQGCQRPMTRATLDHMVRLWPLLEKIGYVFHSGDEEADKEGYLQLDSYLEYKHPHLARARQRKTCLVE